MMLRSVPAACAVVSALAAFAQDSAPSPKFEIADVHLSPPSTRIQGLRTVARNGHYELRAATMVDLVRVAYGIDADRVLEGPHWVEWDRYDVIAKGPARATREAQRTMLQDLLADRFKLVVRKETRNLPGFNLVAGKRPSLKKSAGKGAGCDFEFKNPENGPGLQVSCRNMTTARFAEELVDLPAARQYLSSAPVADKTGLEGVWDFDFHYSFRAVMAAAPGESISLLEAVEKQLGLKLEPAKVPTPVIVVVSANENPSENPPGTAESLHRESVPTEFEVADIKPSAPDAQGMRFQMQPGGRVHITGMTLGDLIRQANDLRFGTALTGLPKWADETRYDIVAKAPAASASTEFANGPRPGPPGESAPEVDFETVQAMLRALLKERFKLAMHEEEQPGNGFVLVAMKPKLKKADPASRTRFDAAPSDGKNAPLGTRVITIQNMTMAQFALQLQRIAPGYIQSPVLDKTGVQGSYDFTLAFMPAGAARGGRGGRGGGRGGPAMADAGPGEPSDPTGAMTLPEAIERQLGLKLETEKRPLPVVVVDKVERPSEN